MYPAKVLIYSQIAAVTDLGWKVVFTGTQVQCSSVEDDLIMVGERVVWTLFLLPILPRLDQNTQSSACPSIIDLSGPINMEPSTCSCELSK